MNWTNNRMISSLTNRFNTHKFERKWTNCSMALIRPQRMLNCFWLSTATRSHIYTLRVELRRDAGVAANVWRDASKIHHQSQSMFIPNTTNFVLRPESSVAIRSYVTQSQSIGLRIFVCRAHNPDAACLAWCTSEQNRESNKKKISTRNPQRDAPTSIHTLNVRHALIVASASAYGKYYY